VGTELCQCVPPDAPGAGGGRIANGETRDYVLRSSLHRGNHRSRLKRVVGMSIRRFWGLLEGAALLLMVTHLRGVACPGRGCGQAQHNRGRLPAWTSRSAARWVHILGHEFGARLSRFPPSEVPALAGLTVRCSSWSCTRGSRTCSRAIPTARWSGARCLSIIPRTLPSLRSSRSVPCFILCSTIRDV
jgi:hypothetical protein